MIDPKDRRLTDDIEAAALTVPGVTALFPAGGVATRLVEAGAQILGFQEEAPPLIRVEHSTDGSRVEVAIGVDAAAGSVATSYRVHDAILALCIAEGAAPAEIRITVVHVDDKRTGASLV